MKRIRIVGLCLVAVFALSAVVAAAAQAAAPEYLTCNKVAKAEKGKGKWNDKECSKESKGGAKEGEYEAGGSWETLKKKGFKGKNGVSTLDSYIPENEAEPWTGGTVVGSVTCKNAKSVGEITGPKLSTVTVVFASCTSEGKKCTSHQVGEKVGDITTEELDATLVNVEGKPASLVKGNNGEGKSAEFSCEGLAIKTFGNLNGLISGNTEGKYKKTSTQTFSVNAKGGQTDPFDEENPGEPMILVSNITPPGVNLPSGENTTSVLTGEVTSVS